MVPKYIRNRFRAALIGVIAMASFRSLIAHAFGPESYKHFFNQAGKPIDFVCVIPSYSKVSGFGVGPDGKGRKSSTEKYIVKPFRYVSSENFYAKLESGGGVIIPVPPGFGFGETSVTDQILFLKSGYLPLRRRGDYDGKTETLTMTSDGSKRAEAVVEAILQRDVTSSLLHEYFLPYGDQQKGSLVINYTAEDDELLKSCLLEVRNQK